jgi:hypothetical protein
MAGDGAVYRTNSSFCQIVPRLNNCAARRRGVLSHSEVAL